MNPRYQIEKPLGEGGMGKVYKAFDLEKHRPVALKFLQNPAWVPYLESETKILAKLRHPHLVEVYDFHPEAQPLLNAAVERGPCLAMEWIEGKPLDEASAEIGWTDWPRILSQLGEGLEYLHRRKLLHRDLKPGNLLWRKDGEIKILDFGLAGPARQAKSVGGSAAYLAPEAWRGEFSIASDLYALGVTLFQCWTGRLPNPPGARTTAAPREVLDPFQLRPELPEYLGHLLLALLQPDPSQRLSSALTLLRYLELHGQRTASASGRLSAPPLVGRKEELTQLQTWLGDPTVGLIVLSGPTGVGRSRLIEESKWNYQISGGRWIELGPADAAEWKKISLSRLGGVGQGASDPWSWSEEIQKAAGEQAAALILRDFAAWPNGVFQELGQALALTAFPGWTWFLDFNVDAANSEAEALIRSLRENPRGKFLDLRDLSEAEAGELFAAAIPAGAWSEVQRHAWWQASGGRPLLLIEGLAALLANPDSTEFAPPKTFEESALRQVAALSEDSQRLLALVLAHPQPLDFSTLGRLWPEGREDWEEAMLQLQAEDFLAGRDPLRPEIRLARESLRGVLSQGLGRSMMAEAHRAWLTHWLSQTKPEPQADEIASRIFNHAAALEDRKLAKDWGPAAARFHETRGEVAQAAAVYRRLLPWAEDFKERYTYQAFLAPLLYRLGRLDEALQSYDLWFADRPDDETRLQKCKHCFYTGLVLFAAARETEAKARFEECLAVDAEGRHSAHRLYRCRALAFLASLEEKHGT
ncbi:MAG TPA: serine/threonine-protein kinase, partial [bacterium]|nr:serine/threonine-protein kinase [bacterium]